MTEKHKERTIMHETKEEKLKKLKKKLKQTDAYRHELLQQYNDAGKRRDGILSEIQALEEK